MSLGGFAGAARRAVRGFVEPAADAALSPMHALRLSEQRALHRRCRETRTLAVTFDDGPSPTMTPLVLEVLAAHRARATFFLLGSRAVAHPGSRGG